MSNVFGYHLQRDAIRGSIMSYLDYIIRRDDFRMHN